MIMDSQEYQFVRKFKYSQKQDESQFTIKYIVSNQLRKSRQKYNPQIKVNRKEQNSPKIRKKYKQYFPQIEEDQLEELRQYQKVNLKKLRKKQRQRKTEVNDIYKDFQKSKKSRKVNNRLEVPPQPNIKRSRSINYDNYKPNNYKSKSKDIYEDYIPLEQIEQSRQNDQKIYYKGLVQCDQRVKYFARIKSSQLEGNLQAQGAHKNRCIHEDQVYFRVLSNNNSRIQCQIVNIIPREKERVIIGKIDLVKSKNIYVIVPVNKRVIPFNIRLNEVSKKWIKQREKMYFEALYEGWPRNSQYPECIIIGQHGQLGKIEVQTSALLKTHSVYQQQYTQLQIQQGLSKFLHQTDIKGQYKIAQEQITKRLDLRNQHIFTIDPLTAKDFDDALSIKKLTQQQINDVPNQYRTKNMYEIGVHIADASFFVEEGGIIDLEAQIRTTSVYLVHRVIPMLPKVLCENMCSLNPGVERLTLSVWFIINQNGQVIKGCRYDRSVINSKARFTYQQAQGIITGQIKKQSDIPKGYGCVDQQKFPMIAEDIILMNQLAMKIRSARIQRGALVFQIPKKSFVLNQKNQPVTYKINQRFAANFLVQQYMLLANEKVAEVLVKQIGGAALLRRHKFPSDKKRLNFQNFMEKIGEPIKISKDTKIQQEINKVLNKNIRKSLKDVIKYQMIFLLQKADYFLVGQIPQSQRIHYALQIANYTHFTSPIRRYPDILVHRQLISVIEAKKANSKDINIPSVPKLKQLIQRCNKNKQTAKKVSNDCEKLFLCFYLKNNPVETKAILTTVQQWGIKISVPAYDFRTTVQLKKMKNLKVIKLDTDNVNRKYLMLQYNVDKEVSTVYLKQIMEIQVKLESTTTFPLDYKVSLILPHPSIPNETIIIK